MGAGLSIFLMLLFFVIGFLLGTRGRQIVAALKATGQAVRSLTIKIPLIATLMGDDTAGDDDGEKEDDEIEDKQIDIDDFIQPADGDSGLADHPDVHLSPVLLYKIKRAKEELRTQQRRAALLAEGFDEGEVEERMQMEADAGGGGGGRANPLALLISVGARVEPTAGGNSAEAVKLQERRRLQRNVDQFLLRVGGIEKYRPEKASHGRVRTAMEMARETSLHPIGGPAREREVANLHRAKEARNLLRDWFKHNETVKAREAPLKKGLQRQRAGAGVANATGGGGGLDMASLAALQAEFAEDDDGDMEGEEGGEEGAEGDDAFEGEEGEEGEWWEGR